MSEGFSDTHQKLCFMECWNENSYLLKNLKDCYWHISLSQHTANNGLYSAVYVALKWKIPLKTVHGHGIYSCQAPTVAKIQVFWDVTLFLLIYIYRHFEELQCFRNIGDYFPVHGVTLQNGWVLTNASVTTLTLSSYCYNYQFRLYFTSDVSWHPDLGLDKHDSSI
jgi:hypothetical protein